MDHLDSRDAEFDLLIALDLIEHLRKDEVFRFLELYPRALKPRGQLILETPNAGSPRGGQSRYGDITHEVGFTARALTQVLRLARFENVDTRETGPIPWGYSPASSFRYLVWQSIRLCLMLWDVVEAGSLGDRVYTRVFIVSAVKIE